MEREELSRELKISVVTAELLLKRGLASADAARDFLYAGLDRLSDPFAIPGMRDAAARIRSAIANGESIVIFGDYDADGISSVSIFYQYFLDRGANAHWYIPEREEGYGINTDAVEFIADEYMPDLIITCDCGISAAAEIEYIKDLGIDVIVTDHHEVPEETPDCITVNPKLGSDEGTAMLCGAGVVFKVVEALEGREYVTRFLDIAAIATVADSVPLFGENRILVREGLKRLNESQRPGIAYLKEISGVKDFNSKALAFSIVPRINAAGRLGAAKRAISLFCGDDEEEIRKTAEELDRANSERQVVCEKILKEIYLSEEFRVQSGTRALIVEKDDWQSGMIGIVASKLAERFSRPVFVFTKSEGFYKGSGRSVDGVNLFQMLSSMSELFVRFGGHSQAAGLTLKVSKYPLFKERVAEYLRQFPRDVFSRTFSGDCELNSSDITLKLCRELSLLEPCGVGNKQPVFLLSDNLPLRPMKKYKMHFSGNVGDAGFTAFNMSRCRYTLSSASKKDYLLDLSVNEYNRKFSPRGNVRSATVPFSRAEVSAGDAVCWLLESFGGEDCKPLSAEETLRKLTSEYGVLIVSYDLNRLKRFIEEYQPNCSVCCYSDNRNNDTKLIFAPECGFEAEGYSEIVYLERPVKGRKGSFYLEESQPYRLGISLDRGVFAEVYKKILYGCAADIAFGDLRELFDLIGAPEDIEETQFFACLLTFLELGFFGIEDGVFSAKKGVRGDLESSAFYRALREHLA